MHEDFIKYGTYAIKLIEELSELIKAICKGERFGYDDANPLIENSKTNREKIYLEIADVELAIKNFKEWLVNLPEDIKRKTEHKKTAMIKETVKLSGSIIITDPRYICIPEYWGRGCDEFLKGGVSEDMFLITTTGIGDISGVVFNNTDSSIVGTFGVDSGVFGVFDLEKLKLEKWFDHEKFRKLPKICYTILNNFEGECRVEIGSPAKNGWGEQYKIVGKGNFDWEARKIIRKGYD